MTVAALRDQMPQAEFVAWGVYYGRMGQRAELARLRGRRTGAH